MGKQMNDYNRRIRAANAQVKEHIKEQKVRWEAGEISRGDYLKAFAGLKAEVEPKTCYDASLDFLKNYGWVDKKISAPTHYLDYDSEELKTFRRNYAIAIDMKGVDQRLVLNYDQVWRLKYSGKLHKDI
jgi:hypothetical protein